MEALVYTPEELCKLLGLSRNVVYGLLAEGKIPSIKLGRRYITLKAALETWLKAAAETDKTKQ